MPVHVLGVAPLHLDTRLAWHASRRSPKPNWGIRTSGQVYTEFLLEVQSELVRRLDFGHCVAVLAACIRASLSVMQRPGAATRPVVSAYRTAARVEERVKPELPKRAKRGGDVAVALRTQNGERICEVGDGSAALGEGTGILDEIRGPFGAIED